MHYNMTVDEVTDYINCILKSAEEIRPPMSEYCGIGMKLDGCTYKYNKKKQLVSQTFHNLSNNKCYKTRSFSYYNNGKLATFEELDVISQNYLRVNFAIDGKVYNAVFGNNETCKCDSILLNRKEEQIEMNYNKMTFEDIINHIDSIIKEDKERQPKDSAIREYDYGTCTSEYDSRNRLVSQVLHDQNISKPKAYRTRYIEYYALSKRVQYFKEFCNMTKNYIEVEFEMDGKIKSVVRGNHETGDKEKITNDNIIETKDLPSYEYEIRVLITKEDLENPLVFRDKPRMIRVINGYDLNLLRQDIDECIYQLIELNQASGTLLVEVEEISVNNMEKYSTSEKYFEVITPEIVYTEEPSKYILWKENQKPHIFSIDIARSHLRKGRN